MFRKSTFKVLSNLILLMVFCTGQVAASPNNNTEPIDAQSAFVTYTAITVGFYHTCGLTSTGGVKCWGYNFNGELGNATNTDSKFPVDVYGLTSGVIAIDAGYHHTCALTSAGGVKCWGSNGGGKLGAGTGAPQTSNVPLDVVGLSNGVREISIAGSTASGGGHSCAVTWSGIAKCWGNFDSNVPVNVPGLPGGITSISSGDYHDCVLTTVGGVKCWGNNVWGDLGNGTNNPIDTPVDVVGLVSGVSHISAGLGHSCAVTSTGGLKCWGLNANGQLGDGTSTNRFAPVSVIGLSGGIKASSAGYWQTCAINDVGSAKCWGIGGLGDGTNLPSLVPVDVFGLTSGVSSIDVGYNHICAITDGGAMCWGGNFYGQLGDGTNNGSNFPVYVYGSVPPPIVNSILRDNPNPTNVAVVDFVVTFSKSVTGVNVSDFGLTTTAGVSGATVSGVSGSGSVYAVTVTTGSGDGTIRLDVVDNNSIVDAASNPLGGAALGDGNFTTGEVYTINKSSIFADVPLDYSVNSFIERLYNAGITGGCSLVPLMYCPENTVTRAQMAVFLLRGIHGSSYVPPAVGDSTGFADVPTNHPVAAWIKQLAAEGITGGCSGGNYCPDATVTRAQMAVFLLRSKYTSAYTPPPANGDFTDVPLDHLMVAWIEQLAAEGITGGCGAGVYCPDGNVTRAQMAVFLVRTFNLP